MVKNKILIIYEDESFTRVLKDKLKGRNISIKIAGDLITALKFFEEESFDLVILDSYIKQPDGNFISYCKFVSFLKSLKSSENTHFILISSTIKPEIKSECFNSGISEVIFKPFSLEEFVIKVKNLLRNIENSKRIKDVFTTNEIIFDLVSKSVERRNILRTSKSQEYFHLVKHIFNTKLSPEGIILIESDVGGFRVYVYKKGDDEFKAYSFTGKYLIDEIGYRGNFVEDPEENIESLIYKYFSKDMKIRKFYGIRDGNLFALFINPEIELKDKLVKRDFFKSLLLSFKFTNTFIKDALEIGNSFKLLLISLAKASEANDEDTGEHVMRMKFYAEFIVRKLVEKELADFSELEIELLSHSAIVHDIGKINVDQRILFKKGRLTEEEMNEVKKHPIYGIKMLDRHPFLRLAREIILTHHEKFDGSGYPFGLKGKEIPLSGRIVSICDVYDALRAKRPYKRGYSHEKAVDTILHGDERTKPYHFDPDILKIFEENNEAFKEIYRESRLKRKRKGYKIFEKSNFTREDFKKLLNF